MAAGVAHEINNPLAFVVNNMALLRRDISDVLRLLEMYQGGREILAREAPGLAAEATRLEQEIDLPYFRENLPRLFARSEEGLRRVRAIVQNLRDFARLDEAEFQEVDINAALRSTLEVLGLELDKKGVRAVTNFRDVPPVSCYAAKIDQAFLNILLNAIQASPREGIIEVRTRPDGDSAVVIEIQDHGVGIPPENLPRIFEPFFTTRPVGAGTGLGLSVSYGVVREQGGTIEAESVVERGSLVRVRLPVRPPLETEDARAIAAG
jgi:signal transduction histidine kinase